MNICGAKNKVHWNEFCETGKIDGRWNDFYCLIKISLVHAIILQVGAYTKMLACKIDGRWDEFPKTDKLTAGHEYLWPQK